MSHKSLTVALALYRSGTFDLERAADHGGVPASKIASELRSRGITVRETEHAKPERRRIN